MTTNSLSEREWGARIRVGETIFQQQLQKLLGIAAAVGLLLTDSNQV
jgi:hypothetical protein